MKQPKERVAKASTGQAFTLFSRAGAQGGDGTLRPRGVKHGGEGDQG